MKTVGLDQISIANNLPFVLIAGPCQIESGDHAMMMAEEIGRIASNLGIPYIFKSSFDKANRTSVSGPRGVGLEASLKIFEKIKRETGLHIITDIHKEEQCEIVAKYVDILQIPALLCRQTDLIDAAVKTGKIVNIKKGQFLAPIDMKNVVGKVEHFGSNNLLLTERGSSFGYNNLVVDMRSLKIMQQFGGYPVILDATHAVQSPGGLGLSSGGDRAFAEVLAYAGIATGIAGLFMEVHNDPDKALSDGPCMIRLDNLERILRKIKRLDEIAKDPKA